MKCFSCVHKQFKKEKLIKGTLLSIAGLIPLVLAFLYLPPYYLKLLGFPLVVIAFFLITIGLLPFKKLTQLERIPDEISINDQEELTYLSKRKPVLSFPLSKIQEITYVDKKWIYGIEFKLEKDIVFLPYFSKASFERIKEIYKPD